MAAYNKTGRGRGRRSYDNIRGTCLLHLVYCILLWVYAGTTGRPYQPHSPYVHTLRERDDTERASSRILTVCVCDRVIRWRMYEVRARENHISELGSPPRTRALVITHAKKNASSAAHDPGLCIFKFDQTFKSIPRPRQAWCVIRDQGVSTALFYIEKRNCCCGTQHNNEGLLSSMDRPVYPR